MEEIKIQSDKPSDEDFSNINLRLLDLSDVDDFLEWAMDPKVSQFCSWHTFTSKEQAMAYIADFIVPHPWFRAICLGDRAIGTISVSQNPGIGDSCRGEIGYVLGSKYWGKGIATRAVKMVAADIFVEWPHLERLEALVDVDNKGSQRVLEKAGFVREGVLRKYFLQKGRARDMVIFSLLSTDSQVNYFMYS
ncbi:Acyl-CoA N-acyltransferase protein [Actinidia chinensis var. chinensis]|uniref:Acyl-CoA N-acyltransferase protein n=1 Tax=Actinidia chinensis var. chinensis TaxID=1590841 RepID=A0A2R6Q3J6_ACTCC|nr:Acyl-CoA N-acyltransferase protein [Actinidia chinensis var. chinensis]